MLVLRFIGQGCGHEEVSVLRGHVNVLRVVLLGGDAPSVDVVVALLLLLALWSLLLQLLTLVLGPPVLEPHLHLQTQTNVDTEAVSSSVNHLKQKLLDDDPAGFVADGRKLQQNIHPSKLFV